MKDWLDRVPYMDVPWDWKYRQHFMDLGAGFLVLEHMLYNTYDKASLLPLLTGWEPLAYSLLFFMGRAFSRWPSAEGAGECGREARGSGPRRRPHIPPLTH